MRRVNVYRLDSWERAVGLYISHIDAVTIKSERTLYLYLLDYGWPDGEWEQLFKKHFMTLATRASTTGAVVIGSHRGAHFGNEVLNWHRVGELSADDVLPGLLITKTHPSYFSESFDNAAPAQRGLHNLLVIPLKPFCKGEADFVRAVEGIFSDLREGRALSDFRVAEHDPRNKPPGPLGRRIVDAIELKPGAFGLSVDVKALLLGTK
jgi:hypothetical protein